MWQRKTLCHWRAHNAVLSFSFADSTALQSCEHRKLHSLNVTSDSFIRIGQVTALCTVSYTPCVTATRCRPRLTRHRTAEILQWKLFRSVSFGQGNIPDWQKVCCLQNICLRTKLRVHNVKDGVENPNFEQFLVRKILRSGILMSVDRTTATSYHRAKSWAVVRFLKLLDYVCAAGR